MFVCDQCHKELKSKRSLARHIEAIHGSGKQKNPENESLEIEVEPEPEYEYECEACDTKITRGMDTCPNPNCGKPLDWSGL